MDISTAHQTARNEASRVPAQHASLALLVQADAQLPERSMIHIYGGIRPTAGEPAGDPLDPDPPVVSVELTASAGTVNEETAQIILTTPIEGQITGADPVDGTIPTWGRIVTPAGDWWADASVSVTGAGGEIQIDMTGTEGDPAEPVARLFNGAFIRVSSAVFGG